MTDSTPYNPLDKRNIGASVAEALLARQPVPLDPLKEFRGAGIYAIYYVGSVRLYKPIATRNANGKFEAPIYVGKAVPAGARKGAAVSASTKSKALYRRLAEHAESIRQTKTLSIDDFLCRHLVVDDIWIPLGETLLIAKFSPIWNSIIDGFGNHDPGGGRYKGMRPRWDVLHPGRPWANRCAPRPENREQIARDVRFFFANTPIPPAPHFFAEQALIDYVIDEGDGGDEMVAG